MSPPMLRLSYNDIHKAIQASAPKIMADFSNPPALGLQLCSGPKAHTHIPGRKQPESDILTLAAPDLFIAIGGGGFIPARILRSFCKTSQDGKKRNIPIQAVGLTLYESLGGVSVGAGWSGEPAFVSPSTTLHSNIFAQIEEVAGNEVVRVQWIDFSTLGSKLKHGGLLGRRILVIDEVDDTRTTLVYTIRELQKDIEKQLSLVEDAAERERLRAATKLAIFVVHNKLKPKAGEVPEGVQYFAAVDTPDVWLAYPWECETDIDEHDALRSENPAI
ncbi:transferase [Trichosporon asahii var. asahii CBS 2479]|uniref:Transferase n=1 Tax=Trichosporon asahii var. asahii (strain ATCC 90039 / CBS 2479 / JCM 2466 / KCTC 7840 / NBRC 103889/ NCYC 2677 / UAMH 7654) TaxID=1186058 RepID=J6ERE9_TRIAS|nr:transferase [Trichosporon asahii var. asahii CBS 2479]EJT47069.1 transferase [Trichosporon asahii var. asahii CBS 2479]